jgi:hypothetical protein
MSKPRTGKEMNCGNCGRNVYVPINRFESFKYCSRSCKALATRVVAESNCKICKNNFSHISSRSNIAKYCSRKCYYISQKHKGSVEKNCKHCGVKFLTSPSKKKMFCSKTCVNKPKINNWNPSFSAVRKNMLARNLVIKCERCGFDKIKEILGIHHKDRNRKNNSMDNLEVLCPNCHSIEHCKHISHGFAK